MHDLPKRPDLVKKLEAVWKLKEVVWKLKEVLRTMFENDDSSARLKGTIEMRRLYFGSNTTIKLMSYRSEKRIGVSPGIKKTA